MQVFGLDFDLAPGLERYLGHGFDLMLDLDRELDPAPDLDHGQAHGFDFHLGLGWHPARDQGLGGRDQGLEPD